MPENDPNRSSATVSPQRTDAQYGQNSASMKTSSGLPDFRSGLALIRSGW